jgi:hypothetical protein
MGLDHLDRFFARKSRRTPDSHNNYSSQFTPRAQRIRADGALHRPSSEDIIEKNYYVLHDLISSTTWFRRRDLKPDQGPHLIQPPTAGRKRKEKLETWLSLAL